MRNMQAADARPPVAALILGLGRPCPSGGCAEKVEQLIPATYGSQFAQGRTTASPIPYP
jgi:hypothetical protein